jgi:hypothetical protein
MLKSMSRKQRTENGIIIQKIFEILINSPGELTIGEIMSQLAPPQQSAGNGDQFFQRVMSSCIPVLKAGWLISRGYYLSVSDSGKQAFQKYSDPTELVAEAATRSAKGWLSFHFPKPYYFAGRTKDQIVAELRSARRIGARAIVGRFITTKTSWKRVLPLQMVRHVELPASGVHNWQELAQYLERNNLQFRQGGHAIYLPPESFRASAFGMLADAYPETAGLKILKERGGVDETNYVSSSTKGDSRLHLSSVHTHKHLTLVANVLYNYELAARLFDLVEITWGEDVWIAYVLEDVNGGTPTVAQWEDGIRKLRQLHDDHILRVALPEGFDDPEFNAPNCEGNALITKEGAFRYIDFQNFLLDDYGSYLKKIALEATEASHFGDQSALRGGRYLYQTVPGVNLPGKRSIEDRVTVLRKLLEAANVSLHDKVVFDVGCNIGMMMGQYLRLGARWAHGWDRPYVTPHTEKLLLALGCTRFSTSGADITPTYDLVPDIPSFLRSDLDGCVVSYLAIRGHIGWLKSLDNIPWGFLIYEGHEGETHEDFERFLHEFRKTNRFEIGAQAEYEDGDSEPRTLAILRKL